MNPNLRKLLVIVGSVTVATVGGLKTVTVFAPDTGVTKAALVDAGFTATFTLRHVKAEAEKRDGTMKTFSYDVWVCASCGDNGEPVIVSPKAAAFFASGNWTVRAIRQGTASGGTDDTDPSEVQAECACKMVGGSCLKGDGSALEQGRVAGTGYPAPYNSFSGAGCVAMPCGALQRTGGPSTQFWPAACSP